MAGPKGYSSYRGKASKWKGLVAGLLVMVILGALTVIRLQQYVVYDDSDRPRLELPSFSKEEPNSSAANPPDGSEGANLTIQEPERKTLQAVALPAGPLADWGAAWALASPEGGCNAAVYTVKDADGFVYMDSQAAPRSAIKTAEGSAAALGDFLKDKDVYSIAKIACFRDPIASGADLAGRGLKNTGGYVFYDGNNDCWLDPAKAGARQYLINLAAACAAAGFDEILLTDMSYPTVGKLNKIDYGPAAAGAPDSLRLEITAFLTELKAALTEYGVKLSILLPPDFPASSASEAAAPSGQSLEDIAPLVDRIFYAPPDAASENRLELLRTRLDSVGAATELVPVLAQLGELGSGGSYLIGP